MGEAVVRSRHEQAEVCHAGDGERASCQASRTQLGLAETLTMPAGPDRPRWSVEHDDEDGHVVGLRSVVGQSCDDPLAHEARVLTDRSGDGEPERLQAVVQIDLPALDEVDLGGGRPMASASESATTASASITPSGRAVRENRPTTPTRSSPTRGGYPANATMPSAAAHSGSLISGSWATSFETCGRRDAAIRPIL